MAFLDDITPDVSVQDGELIKTPITYETFPRGNPDSENGETQLIRFPTVTDGGNFRYATSRLIPVVYCKHIFGSGESDPEYEVPEQIVIFLVEKHTNPSKITISPVWQQNLALNDRYRLYTFSVSLTHTMLEIHSEPKEDDGNDDDDDNDFDTEKIHLIRLNDPIQKIAANIVYHSNKSDKIQFRVS